MRRKESCKMENNHFLLSDIEVTQIQDLCECLTLAIDKIIRRKQILHFGEPIHGAVDGYKFMIDQILEPTEDERLMQLF